MDRRSNALAWLVCVFVLIACYPPVFGHALSCKSARRNAPKGACAYASRIACEDFCDLVAVVRLVALDLATVLLARTATRVARAAVGWLAVDERAPCVAA